LGKYAYVIIPFQVKEDKLDEAKQIIGQLIGNVKEKEPGVLLYQSLQLKKDPTSFIHYIVFSDDDAHVAHRSAPYVVDFVQKLYKLCPKEPFPLFLDDFESCGAMLDRLDKGQE
jgi:quinol monooxygenase YgiN